MSSTVVNRRRLYFAYGSNLHIKQMAVRCPYSRFVGHGILYGHRWQINERGFANIVADQNASVQGVCYLLNREDEVRLDRNEGVAKGAYDKVELQVEIFCRPARLVGRNATDIASDESFQPNPQPVEYTEGATDDVEAADDKTSDGQMHVSRPVWQHGSQLTRGEKISALVYMSEKYITEGEPRAEYITRMNAGIKDALAVGLSPHYIVESIRPYIIAESSSRPVQVDSSPQASRDDGISAHRD